MRIQVLSDLHLEFGHLDPPKTDADVVVAAGDIGVGADFIVDWLSAFDRPVILVAGNHELWAGDFHERLQALKRACAGSRIHFLERNQVSLDGVTFYGCTLWTDFAGGDLAVLAQARLQMNDFAFIRRNDGLLEPEWLARYNRVCLRWLRNALARRTDKTQVVVTHHAPSLKSWGFAADDPIRYAYCNQLDGLLREMRPALWIHGHVHCRSDYYVLDTRVVCNPRGYHPGKLVEAFEPDKIVEI